MPVVINEIEVLVEVTPGGAGTASASSSSVSGESKDEIIRECVEKVMEIINQKNER